MKGAARVRVVGIATLGVEPEIPGPLDELIYAAISGAIADAGLTIDDIDGVCMAASDVLDGRGISTMTLTGATGSLGKSELRVCDDGLAAVRLAAAEIIAGACTTMVVGAWSKLSDADVHAMAPLSLEPAFYRSLGFAPAVIQGLRDSFHLQRPTLSSKNHRWPADTAVGIVISQGDGGMGTELIGFGGSMGRYLVPDDVSGAPIRDAVSRACRMASTDLAEIDRIYAIGLESWDAELVTCLGLTNQEIRHVEPLGADIGYAAGLHALCSAVHDSYRGGCSLVVSTSGIAMQSAHAVVVKGAA